MKYLILFFIAFLSLGFINLDPDPEYPGCINGVGHHKFKVLYTIQDTTGLSYTYDTTFEERIVDRDTYTDTLEWIVTPAGKDTIFWICPRCDSLQVEISDTIHTHVRTLEEIK